MSTITDELDRRALLLDGALATELEQLGCTFSIPALWSASTLINEPEQIYRVHLQYFRAGADVAITASYQASTQGLELHGKLSHHQALESIKQSVELAQKARAEYIKESGTQTQLWVAGSVGPYGAFLNNGSEYRGDYDLPDGIEGYMNWHRPRMSALIDAGIDVLALETIPSIRETLGLLKLLEEFPNVTAWVSFTLKDAQHISDGTPLVDVADTVGKHPQICAVGVNCVPAELVTDALKILSKSGKHLVVYPNSGETWDAAARTWAGESANSTVEENVRIWRSTGARLIGGCCRTGPDEVQAMRRALSSE
jgi:homocysteine S-methyltransferase